MIFNLYIFFNSLEKAPTQAAGSQELNKAAVSGLELLFK